MTDVTTKRRITVSTESSVGPYIRIPLLQVEGLCRLLDENRIRYHVDEYVISMDGGPKIAVVDLGRDGNASIVQDILDRAG